MKEYTASDVLERTVDQMNLVNEYCRNAADWFHDREGKLYSRHEVKQAFQRAFSIDSHESSLLLSELVADDVDPIVQVFDGEQKYVGIINYETGSGWYRYTDYDDTLGEVETVVCAQCVHQSEHDSEVTYARAGEGSFDRDASADELIESIEKHYEAHDTEPEDVETGASLLSGTTIGGNTSWHSGNDGTGSGLDADTVDGLESGDLGGSITEKNVVENFNESDLTLTQNDVELVSGSLELAEDEPFGGQASGDNAAGFSGGGGEGIWFTAEVDSDGLLATTGAFDSVFEATIYLYNVDTDTVLESDGPKSFGSGTDTYFQTGLSAGTQYAVYLSTTDGTGRSYDTWTSVAEITINGGWQNGDGGSTQNDIHNIQSLQMTEDVLSGSALLEWPYPDPILDWGRASFARTLDSETVTIDIEDSNGNVLKSDISPNEPISDLSTSENLQYRVSISRGTTSNNPTFDAAYRQWRV